MSFPASFVSVQNVVLAKLRLDDTTANRNLVKDWVNQAYAQVCLETQALQEAGYATLTAGSSTYTLPSKIIELKWVICMLATDNTYGPPLERVSIETMLGWRQSNNSTSPITGRATAYALIGLNQLEVWPTPQSADTLQFYYSYLPTALSADADVPVLQEPWASKILEYGALTQAAEMQSDPEGMFTWGPAFEDWKAKFRAHMNKRGGMVNQFELVPRYLVPHDNSTDAVWRY